MRLPGKGGGIYYFFQMTIESRVFEERTRRSEGVIHKGSQSKEITEDKIRLRVSGQSSKRIKNPVSRAE